MLFNPIMQLKLIHLFHEQLMKTAMCPDNECHYSQHDYYLYSLITHLNDDHKWSREEIANWLDTLDTDLNLQ